MDRDLYFIKQRFNKLIKGDVKIFILLQKIEHWTLNIKILLSSLKIRLMIHFLQCIHQTILKNA